MKLRHSGSFSHYITRFVGLHDLTPPVLARVPQAFWLSRTPSASCKPINCGRAALAALTHHSSPRTEMQKGSKLCSKPAHVALLLITATFGFLSCLFILMRQSLGFFLVSDISGRNCLPEH